MARHPNQQNPIAGMGRRPLTPRAQQLLARSRNVPAGAPLKRHWKLETATREHTCECCAAPIEKGAEHYADQVSGHLVRHVGCHEKAEAKR